MAVKGDIIDRTIEKWGPLGTINRMVHFFGAQRFTEIYGWCVLGAITSWDDPAELRKKLQEKGMTKSGLYRALRDLRFFGIAIETGAIDRGAVLDRGGDEPINDTSIGVRVMRCVGALQIPLAVP